MDALLLGLVDCLGSLCGNFYCANLKRSYRQRIRLRGLARSRPYSVRFWFSVFGGTTISLEMFDHVAIKQTIDKNGIEVALFTVLEQFPLGTLMSMIAIFLIATFFITSADSATFVLGTLTTHGNLNPPNHMKFTWGIIQSVSAAVLLWSGGLKALQTGSIIAAFPFAFIIVLMILSLLKSFKQEVLPTQ